MVTERKGQVFCSYTKDDKKIYGILKTMIENLKFQLTKNFLTRREPLIEQYSFDCVSLNEDDCSTGVRHQEIAKLMLDERTGILILVASKIYAERPNKWFYIEPAMFYGFKGPTNIIRRGYEPAILIILGPDIENMTDDEQRAILGGLLCNTGKRLKISDLTEEYIEKFIRKKFKLEEGWKKL